MMAKRLSLSTAVLALVPVILALLFTTVVLLLVGANPLVAYQNMLTGAFGSVDKLANDVVSWIPLVLCGAGLMYTFTAGLWNIGIEGQIVAGAIATTWVARTFNLPPVAYIPLLLLGGAVGGALWALLAGVLKTYGKVHEIFAGLGLNFVAIATTNFLVFGPWKQPGIASMSGTEMFRDSAWLPTLGKLNLGPIELVLAIAALVVATFTLSGHLVGLRLKAIGKNARAAFILGVETDRNMLLAFAAAGACAGLAGAFLAIGVFHRLIPSISSGYGYLAILVVLLAGRRGWAIALVGFFFIAAMKGGMQLPMAMHLDSSLAGVLQGLLVLFVVLAQGVRSRQKAGPAREVGS